MQGTQRLNVFPLPKSTPHNQQDRDSLLFLRTCVNSSSLCLLVLVHLQGVMLRPAQTASWVPLGSHPSQGCCSLAGILVPAARQQRARRSRGRSWTIHPSCRLPGRMLCPLARGRVASSWSALSGFCELHSPSAYFNLAAPTLHSAAVPTKGGTIGRAIPPQELISALSWPLPIL